MPASDSEIPTLTSVTFENYRCFQRLHLDLSPITVLIGANGTGKTSALRAFLTLRRLYHLGLIAQQHRELPADERTRGNQVGEDAYTGITAVGVLGRTERGRIGFVSADARNLQPDDQARAAMLMPSVIADRRFALTSSGIRTWEVRNSRFFDLPTSDGGGLGSLLLGLGTDERPLFDALMRDYVRLFPDVFKIGVKDAQWHFRGASGTRTLEDIPDGHLAGLFLLCLVHHPNRQRLILLDQPEQFLHPLLFHQVVELLRGITKDGTRIVIATHSADLLSEFQPEAVYLFTKDQQSGYCTAKRVSEIEDVKFAMAGGWTLGDLFLNLTPEGLADIPASAGNTGL